MKTLTPKNSSSSFISMASPFHFLTFLTSILFLIISPSISKPSSPPKSLLLPVTRDPVSLQYITQISQRTPLITVKLTVDLNGPFLWVHCENRTYDEQIYFSSTSRKPRCGSAQCNLFDHSPACGVNNTCIVFPENSVVHSSSADVLLQDILSLRSTDGFNPRRTVSVPKFLFGCSSSFLIQGLAQGVEGVAGLGRSRVSLPVQFAAAFGFKRKFALCLSSSKGVMFFGNGPYNLLPNVEIASLSYTPLILNPIKEYGDETPGQPSPEYYIGVKSILVNGKPLSLNTSLLTINLNGTFNQRGKGGTRISTVDPYTVLETSIYKALEREFDKGVEAPRVAAVAPFKRCYDVKKVVGTRLGARVPLIELVLDGGKVWRIFGGNSMVVKGNAICLGFVDGGRSVRTAIVIGGFQLEDNLLEFDLVAAKVGFSGSLLSRQTTCANFNFTTKA